jgi:hypothetical protein
MNDKPERIEIPPEHQQALVAAIGRHTVGVDLIHQAALELRNIRLQVLLDARVDRPELYRLDVKATPPALVRLGVEGQTPAAGVPADSTKEAASCQQ